MLDTYAVTSAPSSPLPTANGDEVASSATDDFPALFAAFEQMTSRRGFGEPFRRFADAHHSRAQPLGVAAGPSARHERALYNLGPAAIPWLAAMLENPRRNVRRAAARVLARYGEAAVGVLVDALRQPLARSAARDALANIGLSAVAPLVDTLRNTTNRDTYAAADAALSAIAGVATRREIGRLHRQMVFPWITGAVAAVVALVLCGAVQADLGLELFVIMATTYFGWALAVVHDDHYYDVNHHYGRWHDIFTAPFQYRAQLRNLATRIAERAGFERRHRLDS